MAFSITVTPVNLGSLKGAIVTPTITGTGTNTLSVTPATFGMTRIVGAYSEAGDTGATGGTIASGVVLRYERAAGTLSLWSLDSAGIVNSNNTALTATPSLLVLGV